jgi:hypothetical protein
MKKLIYFIFILYTPGSVSLAQDREKVPVKISHAEPIFVDLIRDLGARKGEKELNIGVGMLSIDSQIVNSYLVEYEFAPVNRLGIEIEIPLIFHHTNATANDSGDENDGMEGIKMAVQYSFFVSEKFRTTMAVGYIYETRRKGFDLFSVTGSMHNPFFIVAKKWGSQFHTLVNAGPAFEHDNADGHLNAVLLVNTDIHYVLPGTKNFVGIEFNKEMERSHFKMMFRPQVKMALTSTSSVGIALGIPAGRNERDLDVLVRWIYEFKKKIRH